MPRVAICLEQALYQHDVAVLSSYLKTKEIDSKLFFKEIEGMALIEKIRNYAPSHVVLPSEFRAHGGVGELISICSTAEDIKKKTGIPTVLFGRQATITGENLLKKFNGLDYVVIGDPEYPIADLVLKGAEGIPGLIFFDRDRNIIKNPVGMQTDLNALSMPDFDSFFQHEEAAKMGFFMPVSRGCAYRCAFCQNASFAAISRTKQASPRFYAVEWIIENLLYLNRKYGPVSNFYFTDTNFTFSKDYLRKFISLYKQKLRIPFICATRANLIDEETADLLKEGNCQKVNFGSESGDEGIRNNVIKKNLRDEQIIRCVSLLKKRGIRVQTVIMVGLPDDNFSRALDSLYKASRFGADVLNVSIFQPYCGTELTKYAIKKGYLGDDFTQWKRSASKQHGRSPLNLPDMPKIENLQLLSPLIKRMPNKQIFSFLCLLPKNRIYFAIYHLSRIMRSLRYEINKESFLYKTKYLLYNLGRVFIKGKRPYNR